MITYQLIRGGIRRFPDGAWIPNTESNTDWRKYQEWLAAGNMPMPFEPPDTDDDIVFMAKLAQANILPL